MGFLSGIPIKLLIFAMAASVLGWALTGVVLRLAERGGLVAAPSARGLHARVTPVGGGLGFVAAAAVLWALWPVRPETTWQWAIAGALAWLVMVSTLDDRRPLPAGVRFAAQVAAVGLVLAVVPMEFRILPWLPLAAERVIVGFLWVWLVNAVNFMDGSDGFAGVEGVAVAVGYAIVSQHLTPAVSPFVAGLDVFAMLFACALIGFLVWNWAPAKIFMGDAGSIPLGFLIGLFAFDLALRGAWPAALILPLYFVVDATLTLLRRIARRERFWEAHREHAYQKAILGGVTHEAVATRLAVLNVALVALAVVSLTRPNFALVCAATMTLILFGLFSIFGARAQKG